MTSGRQHEGSEDVHRFDWPFHLSFICVLAGLVMVIFGAAEIGAGLIALGAVVLFVLSVARRVSLLEWVRNG